MHAEYKSEVLTCVRGQADVEHILRM